MIIHTARIYLNDYECAIESDYISATERIDRFVRDATLASKEAFIYHFSELEERHAADPYNTICIELPYVPETSEDALAPEQSTMLGEAIRFADEHQLPVYYKLPSCMSPVHLFEELTYYKGAYQTVSGAHFWKITKPFRLISDGIKWVFRKFPPTRALGRSIKMMQERGIRQTLAYFKRRMIRSNRSVCGYDNAILEEQRLAEFEKPIKFSILVPLYNTPAKLLKELIHSVQNQTYPHWELCLGDGSDSEHAYVGKLAQEAAAKDPRIVYRKIEKNAGISGNTNFCAAMATGDYLGFLDHDDLLAPTALYMNAMAISETDADVVYSDEDHITEKGKHCNPLHKPDFSIDLLYSQMYICHFTTVRKKLFDKLGGFDSAFDGSQDYDLMLRLTEHTKNIYHIPAILYHWRETAGSTAANAEAKPYAHEAGRRALDAHLKRRYGELARAEEGDYLFCFDARFDNLHDTPLISIIIPMKDHSKLSDGCVRSILNVSTYQNFEILILDNRSEKPETFKWFEKIQRVDPRVRVITANMEFNWAMLNNFGAKQAKGELLVFLNNDTEVISPDWLERLSENARRPDVGVVGGLLLYEDDTIQHAGIVVGMNGMADHVFKAMAPVHFGSPYISPMMNRNCVAVTGALHAIERVKLDRIGGYDESFIICGSDVELCIRAYEYGYNNLYNAHIRLHHLESKSRSSYIPPIDFKRSLQCYDPYLKGGDPFYNINLQLNSTTPKEDVIPVNMIKFKRFVKRIPPVAAVARKLRRELMPSPEYNVPEIQPLTPRRDESDKGKLRLNFLTPSVDIAHVFGGISTAMNLFEALRKEVGCEARILSTDADVVEKTSTAPEGYVITEMQKECTAPLQLVAVNDRFGKTVPVRENDVFVCTAWWTAYNIRSILDWQAQTFGKAQANPVIYIIQDYEPGFYPWSSRYMMADSTYRFDVPTYAIFNSKLLKDFFDAKHYHFARSWYFDPVLNRKLAEYLPKSDSPVSKKKQILVYGRPSVDRNAFALVVETLKLWKKKQSDYSEWTLFSAGETHGDVDLGDGCYLQSLGKLSLEDYAKTMLDTYAGLSLMVSPHPSYPPLEMSTFGIKTVTNAYDNKDLTGFNENIRCQRDSSPRALAATLLEICAAYDGQGSIATDNDYAKGGSPFGDAVTELARQVKQDFGGLK